VLPQNEKEKSGSDALCTKGRAKSLFIWFFDYLHLDFLFRINLFPYLLSFRPLSLTSPSFIFQLSCFSSLPSLLPPLPPLSPSAAAQTDAT